MAWDFFKKRWFTLALLLILLFAIARKNWRGGDHPPSAPVPEEKPEIYTEDPTAARNASMLKIGSEQHKGLVPMPVIDDQSAVAFLQRFGKTALEEQQKFGIPASIILASAYVNSFAGKRPCAREINNYLAVPCTKDWNGQRADYQGRCLRKYATAWESIRGFNLYLQQQLWFGSLKKSAGLDWKAWVNGLSRQGVSDVQNFDQELITVIEAYRLFELDKLAN